MSLLTAWQFLIELGHAAPNPFLPFPHEPVPLAGKTVVVNGAGGGVGHLLVQLARWQGARVIAVGSGRNAALMRDFGVERFVDYTKHAAEDVIRDADLVVFMDKGRVIEMGGFAELSATNGRFASLLRAGGLLTDEDVRRLSHISVAEEAAAA